MSTGKGVDFVELGSGEFVIAADQTTFPVQITSPVSPLFSDASLGLVNVGGTYDGSLAYRDALNVNALNLTLGVASDTTANGVRTIKGAWTYSSGLGRYDGFSPPDSTGDWSFAWTLAGDTTRLDVHGELKGAGVVPEPAPLAALGLGLLATVRRKRRRLDP